MPVELITIGFIGGGLLGIGLGRLTKASETETVVKTRSEYSVDRADVDPERLRNVDAESLDTPKTSWGEIDTVEKDRVGYKKAKTPDGREVILRLIIPRGARMLRANKCRAEHVYVDDIFDVPKMYPSAPRNPRPPSMDKSIHDDNFACGNRYEEFIYSKGQLVSPEEPFDTSTEVCASGIHFFERRADAINW